MKKETALKHFGTEVAIASTLGIKRQAVNKWKIVVPWAAALELQTITGGLLRRDESLYEKRKPKALPEKTPAD